LSQKVKFSKIFIKHLFSVNISIWGCFLEKCMIFLGVVIFSYILEKISENRLPRTIWTNPTCPRQKPHKSLLTMFCKTFGVNNDLFKELLNFDKNIHFFLFSDGSTIENCRFAVPRTYRGWFLFCTVFL
jgi:hypothetical protein